MEALILLPEVYKSSVWRLQLPEILQITVGFLQFKKLPTPLSNQGTEVDYTLLGLLDCHQEEDKRGALSYVFTLVKFQMKTKKIEESSGDYITVVNTLPNITSNS